MKKHVKILAALGLVMPLSLSSAQAEGASAPHYHDAQVESDGADNNMVINRISDYAYNNQSQHPYDHVNIHNDRPHVDTHSDREKAGGGHANTHSDRDHTDNHIDSE